MEHRDFIAVISSQNPSTKHQIPNLKNATMTKPTEENVKCPHCEEMVVGPWMAINRRATIRNCPFCEGLFLIRANIDLEVLKMRKPKPGEF